MRDESLVLLDDNHVLYRRKRRTILNVREDSRTCLDVGGTWPVEKVSAENNNKHAMKCSKIRRVYLSLR